MNHHWLMSQPHIRRQIDPEFRRKEMKKQENFRVSQWFDRYISQGKSILKEEIQTEYRTYYSRITSMSRESSSYVETQFELLYSMLNKLKENEDDAYHSIKHQMLRTLSLEHQILKQKLLSLK